MKKLITILFCLFIFHSVAMAQSSYNLNDCFKAAIKHSELIAGDQEQIKQAEEHFHQALAGILPNINANLTYFSQDTSALPQTTPPIQTSTLPNQTTTRLSLAFPLFRGFRDFAALSETKNLSSAEKENLKAAALQLYADTSQAFYLVLSLENDLSLLKNESELYNKRIAELQERVNIGRSRQTEVLTVQVSMATLKAQIEQAKAQVSTARELLAFLTGLSPSIELADKQTISTDPESLETYLNNISNRPDIKSASNEAQAANEAVKIAGGAFLPSADLSGNYYLNRPQGPPQNSRYDSQIYVSLPLFAGGYNVSKLSEARSQLRQKQLIYKRTWESNLQSIKTIYFQYRSDIGQANEYAKAKSLAEKNFKAISDDYSNGLVTNLDVLQALTSLNDVSRASNAANYSMKTDYNKLLANAALVKIPEELSK